MSFRFLPGIMRVMAITALAAAPVCAIYDARHCASVAIRVSKICMTPEAKLPAVINRQRLNTDGRRLITDRRRLNAVCMIYRWSMTVFALDSRMGRGAIQADVFFMTLSAGVSALILDGKVFPVLEAAQAVIAVGEISAMNAEVIRDQKSPGEDD